MPYHVARSGSCPSSQPWAVLKDADGEVMGCHTSKDAAERQLAALYAAGAKHLPGRHNQQSHGDGVGQFDGVTVVGRQFDLADGALDVFVDEGGVNLLFETTAGDRNRSGGLDRAAAWRLAGLLDPGGGEDGEGDGLSPKDSVATYSDGQVTGFAEIRARDGRIEMELLDNDSVVTLSRAEARQLSETLYRYGPASRVQTSVGPQDVYLADDDRFVFRVPGEAGEPVEVRFSAKDWAGVYFAVNLLSEGFDEQGVVYQPGEEFSQLHVNTSAGKVRVQRLGPAAGDSVDDIRISPVEGGWSVLVPGDGSPGHDAFFYALMWLHDFAEREGIYHLDRRVRVTKQAAGVGLVEWDGRLGMYERKQVSRVQIKDADRGEVSAVIAAFNVVDSDGDVTLPGAFEDGAEFPISAYGHKSWEGALPVGVGRVRNGGHEAIIDAQFFMDTQHGRDTFTTVKRLGSLGQWSYGYEALDAYHGDFKGRRVRFLPRQVVHEASPVLVGAGVGTRTLSAKSGRPAGSPPGGAVILYKAAIRPHETVAVTKAWDAAAVVADLADDAGVADLRAVHAWVDSDGDPEAKGSYRYPHHHGPGGAANVKACLTGIAALNGARGGTSIPDSDRQGVYNHLAQHLRDADREPPELRAPGSKASSLSEVLADTLVQVSAAIEAAERAVAVRAQKGRQLTAVTAELVDWLGEDLSRLRAIVSPEEAALREYLRYVAQASRAAIR